MVTALAIFCSLSSLSMIGLYFCSGWLYIRKISQVDVHINGRILMTASPQSLIGMVRQIFIRNRESRKKNEHQLFG